MIKFLLFLKSLKENFLKITRFAALLTDLLKAFDCLPHDLIIGKLHDYGLDKASLRHTHSYLTNRYQTGKSNNFYTLWSCIKYAVRQGSILGSILFNIFFR